MESQNVKKKMLDCGSNALQQNTKRALMTTRSQSSFNGNDQVNSIISSAYLR